MKIVLYVNGIHLWSRISALEQSPPVQLSGSIAQSARGSDFTPSQSNTPQYKYIQIDKYFYVNNFSRVAADGGGGGNAGNAAGRVDEEPPPHASLLVQT